MMNAYRYQFTNVITVADVLRLFAQTSWAASRSPDAIQTMLDHTPVSLGVWDGDHLIGFARAVTDDVFRAVIEDVVVDAHYRGRGIGAGIMHQMLERLAHVEEIALVCVDDLIPFYESFGFERFTMTHMHIWKGS